MTACVNKKSKRVAAVVTASLVGALSIGAPAVAFATDTNTGIELLTADANKDFANGSVLKVNDSNGNITKGVYSVTATGKVIDVKVTKVETATGAQVDIDTKYSQAFVKADEKGKPTGEYVTSIKDPGKYCVEVKAVAGEYKGAVIYVPVDVKAADFNDSLAAYEVKESDASDATDTSFYYNGQELNVGIKAGNTGLVEGVDYEVKFLKAGSSIDAAGVEVKDAGTYYAVVTGLGMYAGQKEELPSFTVYPFDLSHSDVTVVVDPVINSNALPTVPSRVILDSGDWSTELDPSLVKLTLVPSEGIFSAKGEYTFTVSPATDNDKNFKADKVATGNTCTVEVGKYAEKATMLYDGEEWPSAFTTDLANDKSPRFDDTKITASYGDDGKSTIANSDVKVTVTDAEGNVVTDPDWKETPGVYTVKAVAKTNGAFDAAAIETCTVTVKAEKVDADAKVYVKFRNKVVTDVTVDWSNANILTSFTAVGEDNDENSLSTENGGLVLTAYDSDGEKVSKIKDAGTYTVKVTSPDYELTGTTEVKVTVNKLDLSNVKIDGDAVDTKFGFTYVKVGNLALKGLNLKYLQGVDVNTNGKLDDWKQFNQIDGDKTNEISDVKSVWQKLDEKTGQWADVNQVSANETGKFRCVVSPMNDSVTKNVSFATAEGTVFEFYVLDEELKYADVLPTDWWFNSVNEADGLMNGYDGTSIFGAQDKLTRGQVAVILYNMAGGRNSELLPEGSYNEIVGWTSFDDVNGKEYYGKAIAWAKKAGVVNGYADGTFRPDNDISREEFACMLANFAKKFNAFQEVDVDEVLDDYNDGAFVSDWAKESVAWAAKNKIMGKTGSITPASMITRAEAAAMAVDSSLRLDK